MTLMEYKPADVVRIETAQDVAVHRLAEWAQSADAAYKVATRLVESSFVPQGFRGKPIEATAAILAGIEVGLSPMSALRAFDVIQGQAAPRAITLRAVAQSHGHEIVMVESTATRCRMKGRRKGETEWQSVTWTLDRARDLGLTGKPNWKQQPQAMLVARATSEIARLVAADAILGIGYSAEEIADGGSYEQTITEVTTAEQPAPATRRMRREPAPQAVEDVAPVEAIEETEPTLDGLDEFHPDTTSNPAPEDGISSAQTRMLHALLRDNDLADRIGSVIGQQIGSTKELSKAQASQVIDALNALGGAE